MGKKDGKKMVRMDESRLDGGVRWKEVEGMEGSRWEGGKEMEGRKDVR